MSAERMRVLFVHHEAALSGSARSLAMLLESLPAQIEPIVVTPPGDARELFARYAPVRILRPLRAVIAWDTPPSLSRAVIHLREIPCLRHLGALRELARGVDIVHLNDTALLPVAGALSRLGKPIVQHARSSLPAGTCARVVRAAARRWVDAIAAIDSIVLGSWRGCAPSTIVPNPVDLPAAIRGPRLSGHLRLGFVGPLRAAKGWEDVVRGVAIARRAGVEVRLSIVGLGLRGREYFARLPGRALARAGVIRDEEGALRALVRELGISRHVDLHPYTEEVGRHYAEMDLIASPVRGPGIARPVLEAAAWGVPAIVSATPGIERSSLPGDPAYAIPAGDPAACARAIEDAARHRERLRESGRRARREALTRRAEHSARAVLDLYESL